MVYLPHWPIPSTLGGRQIDHETVFERMTCLLERLGNPHQKLPPVIHVAGTNGKGSAVALIAKIFSCAGYKTHIYSSPHLHECNERIILAGEKISDNFLFEIMEEVRIASAQGAVEIPLTFTEAFTIGAFLAFAKTPADIAIIECGMGGRIDATNIIEKKLAAVIMPISFDHTEYLGNSIERIALEKSMIMRREASLIVAPQPKEARQIIEILARDQAVKTYFCEEDFNFSLHEKSGEFDFKFGDKIWSKLPKPALPGRHQYGNFATAIATALVVSEQFQIGENHIRQAISTVQWPSRLEKIENGLNKILKNSASEIWIDGAHNEAGASALARWIADQSEKFIPSGCHYATRVAPRLAGNPCRYSNEITTKTFVICGFSRGKCKKEFLEKFRNLAEIMAVGVGGEPYPERPEVIVEIGKSIGIKISPAADLLEAIFLAAKSNSYKPCRLVICGSLHLARDVRRLSLSYRA